MSSRRARRGSGITPAIWASLSYLAWGWAIPTTSASASQPTGFDQLPDARLARAASRDGDARKPIPPRPRAWHHRLTAWLAPLALVLAFLTGARPVLADTCVPTAAAFPPGHWVARGISTHAEDDDGRSVVVVAGTGGFDLTVDDLGAAHGSFSLAGQGYVQSWQPGDDGGASASYLKTGEMSGTASVIQIDGETNVEMEGLVDVEPNHDGDLSNASGQDLYGFGNEFTMPFTAQFSPSAASCNTVFGSLGGPVEYGTTAAGGESYFLAYREGAAPASVDVQGQLAELLEDAQFVLNMDPVDTEVLARFVLDMLQFESLLASLESCDPGNELEMGATWQMLQSVTFNTIRHFLDAAGSGAYTTADVITAIGIWIQGGSLGWRASDCLDINTADGGAMDLFVKFEDILLQRYEIAKDGRDIGEMKQIAAAGYQYGLSRVIAAVEAD
jgi:hypothetical protein